MHYESYPVNPGGQGWIRESAARTEEGGLGTQGPPGGDIVDKENAVKLYTVCDSLIQLDRKNGQQSSSVQRRPLTCNHLLNLKLNRSRSC